jgi:hypothetical protein
MAEDYLARNPRSRPPTIVRNPVASEAFAGPPLSWPRGSGPVRIVYTGSLYSAQADAARSLVEALNTLGGLAEWHIYSAQSPDALTGFGMSGPFVHVNPHLDHDASLRVQREADVLFLPLAFKSAIPEVIRSSAPAKMAEYIAALRPILAHAPAGSFVSRFFRETGAGLVVDAPGAQGLEAALRRLNREPQVRQEIIAAALRVRPQFEVSAARQALRSALNQELRA